MADIEELLGGSDSEEEPDVGIDELERRTTAGNVRWYGRAAKTSLSLALSCLLDSQADLTNTRYYDHIRPRFDRIRDEIHNIMVDIDQKVGELLTN